MYRLSLVVIVFISIFSATYAFADGSYRWEDKMGHTYYGSKPPAGAKNVTRLSGKGFSRYSSERMLGRYKKAARLGSSSSKNLKPITQIDETAVEETPIVEPIKESDLPNLKTLTNSKKLEQGELSIQHDQDKNVTECAVVVKNKSDLPASRVTVAFEFPDGLCLAHWGA